MPGGLTHPARLDAARAILDRGDLDALLVSRTANKRWLSGFVLLPGEEPTARWSGTLLVTRDRAIVLADARYTEQAGGQCPGWEVRLAQGEMHVEVPSLARQIGVRRIGAEASVLSHAQWAALEAAGLELVPEDSGLDDLRIRKDADELGAIERACALTDRCFAHLLETVRPGMTEREVAWQIETFFRASGADGAAFTPLVLVGARAAMPHGHASDVPVRPDAPLLLDFGCQVDGYRSDMTRTIFFGEPDAEARRRYEAVREAQQRAFEAAAVGVTGRDVDAAARDCLAEGGRGEAFTHGLGHGIGLETHESPMLKSWDRPLQAGMVFTLEPGVYLPGEIGIRIEDTVVLEAAGPRRLTHSPRELLLSA
ncbi:MAG TPA: Xaa-Pro peptidase family protein [Candidatus Limnocylindria bacterium]